MLMGNNLRKSSQNSRDLASGLKEVRFAQLEPHGSEMTRPWGFVLRGRRDRAAYPRESQGVATFAERGKTLFRRRARLHVFTRSAL